MRETPLEVSVKYAHTVTWPITKPDLLEAMQRNGAPTEVLEAVSSYKLSRFVAPSDLHMALRPTSTWPSELN